MNAKLIIIKFTLKQVVNIKNNIKYNNNINYYIFLVFQVGQVVINTNNY